MNKRDRLVEENLGLVHSCCKRFVGRGIEYDDLYSAGCIGLVKAIDNFDDTRGLKLSTYAVPVMLGEIKQLFRDGGAVKVSRSLKELALKATRLNAAYLRETGRELSVAELASKLSTEPEKMVEALSSAQIPLSLTCDYDDGEGEQIDVPVDCVEEKLAEKMSLHQVIDELESLDREIIVLRYFKQRTQTQTAQSLGMTQVQVSRREKKILQVLRQKLTV